MRRCAFLLCLLFSFSAVGLSTYAQNVNDIHIVPEKYKNHPEFGLIRYENDPQSYELIHLRKVDERVFTNASGQFFHQKIKGAFHYLDHLGRWMTIQTIPQSGRLDNEAHLVGIFGTDVPLYTNTITGLTTVNVDKNMQVVQFGERASFQFLQADRTLISEYSSTINPSSSSLLGKKHQIKNYFPSIDRSQHFEFWNVQTDYIVRSIPNFPINAQFVSVTNFYRLPIGCHLERGKGTQGENGWIGDLNIVDASGKSISNISPALTYDSFKAKDKAEFKDHATIGEYQWEMVDGGYLVKILLPKSYFTSPSRVYPITIDPIITNTYAGGSGLQDVNNQFNANCAVTQSITLPAGSSYNVSNTATQYTIQSKGIIDTEPNGIMYSAIEDEQRSRIGCNGNWTPTQIGFGQSFGLANYAYNIPFSTIANGCYAANAVINYDWQGYNSYFPVVGMGISNLINIAGCSIAYQELLNNTWVVTTTYDAALSSMTFTPASNTLCSGQSVNITLSSTLANTTYAWTQVQTGVSGASNGTGNTINQVLSATGALSGSVTYTVTPTHGACVGIPQTVVVSVSPAPVIDGGVDVTVCAGAAVTLSGSGGTTYTWDNGIQDGVPFFPMTTTTYTVSSTVNGCPGTDQVTVTIDGSLFIDAGPTQIVCTGMPVTLSASGSSNYVWTNNVQDGVPFIPLQSGLYTVTSSQNGCLASDTVSVYVLPFMMVPVADQTICSGGSISIPFASNSPFPTLYTWTSLASDASGNSSSQGAVLSDVLVSTNDPASVTYTVIGSNVLCQTPPISFVVNILPTPVYTGLTAYTLCENTLLNAALTADLPGTSFSWTATQQNASGASAGTGDFIQSVFAVPQSGQGTVTYSVVPTLGTCNGIPATVVVTVEDEIKLNAGPDKVVCEGSSTVLSAAGASNYIWNNNIQNGQSFSPAASGVYIVNSNAGSCIIPDTVKLTVVPLYALSFTPNTTEGCVPFSVSFISPQGFVNGTCLWTFGDGQTGSSCQMGTNTYTTPGCYDVKYRYTSPEGCVSEVTYLNLICVSPAVVADFGVNPNELTVLNSTAQMLNNTTGATDYMWSFGDMTPQSYLENPMHSFPNEEPGIYQIRLIASNAAGCTDTAYVTIHVNEDLIYFVPNAFTPNGDEFNPTFKPIMYSGYDPHDYEFTVYNRWGEIIFVSHDPDFGWDGTYDRNSSIIQDGVYHWEIKIKILANDSRKFFAGTVTLIK